ncbi:MAG: phosphate ABC transporter permease PstA [Bacteriovoracia bacterium]
METRFSEFVAKGYPLRKFINWLALLTLVLATLVAIVPLFHVFGYVLKEGFPALNWSFFTEIPKPVGEAGGGMANALVGSAILVVIAAAWGVPWGMLIGIYLSEYGRGRIGTIVRFSVDMLASIPSIIIGLFVYALVVVQMKRFSALAGALALGILMVPTVARATEEILKMVPVHIREAGLALGLPRWKVILRIVLRGSVGAITTGVMLSLARVAGETAPLLFTALSNRFWHQGLDQPIASLPVQIYNYAISPFDDWHRQAWAGAFVLVALVFSLNLLTRLVIRQTGSISEG